MIKLLRDVNDLARFFLAMFGLMSAVGFLCTVPHGLETVYCWITVAFLVIAMAANTGLWMIVRVARTDAALEGDL